MQYFNLYNRLKEGLNTGKNVVNLAEFNVTGHLLPFQSMVNDILPGSSTYDCALHDIHFSGEANTVPACDNNYELYLKAGDRAIKPNQYFHYWLFEPNDAPLEEQQNAILMLHGLNEKSWDKYFPWAIKLAQLTKRKIILFPIAFHMDRAPELWSDKKSMFAQSESRLKDYPNNSNSSFVNAAISERLSDNPSRVFWSGYQTYLDIVTLIKQIKKGDNRHIASLDKIDLFGYSIGAFVSLIILMSNPLNYFKNSKLVAFCGGATFDRMYPDSKYIMDTEAALTVHNFFAEGLNNNFNHSKRLGHYLDENLHPHGACFKYLLQYNQFKQKRENLIKEVSQNILAMPLKQDTIVPPGEVMATLQGELRDIATDIQMLDFEYPYSHFEPFSKVPKYSESVDNAFNLVMGKAADFFLR